MAEENNRELSLFDKVMRIGTTGVMTIIVIASFYIIFYFGKTHRQVEFLQLIITLTGMFFSMLLFMCSCFIYRDNSKQGKNFIMIAAMMFVNFILMGLYDVYAKNNETGRLIYAAALLSTLLSTAIHLLFWNYQADSLPDNHAKRIYTGGIHSLMLVYAALTILDPITGIMFSIDASGFIVYNGAVFDLTVLLLFYISYLLYILPQRCPVKKKISLACFAIFPLAGIILSWVWYRLGITYTMTVSVYIFVLLAAYVVFFTDYLENRAELLKQKAELAEQKNRQAELQTQLMLSQIRPHFLYNALTAIRNLCKTDPQGAYTALGRFSDYLRGNMEALGSERVIPFEKELEHIQTYLMLEQMRFEDELKVVYDIRFQDFSLPALTIQPIVENAVKYGATMNPDGGVITISTEKTDDGAVIIVKDNGPGFDLDVPFSDERTHFGLENARKSLAAYDCGELNINSAPEKGTTVTIRIKRGG